MDTTTVAPWLDGEGGPLTWAAERELCGIPARPCGHPLYEAVRRLGAADRHEWRVGRAIQALRSGVLASFGGEYSGWMDPIASLWAAVEAEGWTFRGISMTMRPSWARGLGSGRRCAGDGPAWTAAIAAAAARLHRPQGEGARIIVGDLPFVLSFDRATETLSVVTMDHRSLVTIPQAAAAPGENCPVGEAAHWRLCAMVIRAEAMRRPHNMNE